ncbi:MAG: hydrogenase 4 subunit B, partial [Nonomuraea sp.]|nr:hydrogenase 4 subunit B [Nonomuraea sp.]
MTGPLFAAALAVCALAALAVPLLPNRALVSGVGTAAGGVLGAAAGVSALAGGRWSAWLPDLLPLAGVRLALDPLGGLFVAVTGAVAVCAGLYAVGYARDLGRIPHAVLPLFVASMLLVPAAASVSTLLLGWELMALTSLLLVLTEHARRPAVARAGL